MSFDLEVASSHKPDVADVREFMSSREGYAFTGAFDGCSGNLLIQASQGGAGFTVDGPAKAELEDLAEELAAAVLAPQWLVRISVPLACTAKDVAVATALARFLAEKRDGAVYDPQKDKVVFPRGKRRRYQAPASEERIRLVSCDYFLPSTCFGVATASEMLRILRRTLPEAVPTRFGTCEPLQKRLPEDDDKPFLDLWRESAAVPFGTSFFWKATRPSCGGSVSFPDWRNRFKPDGVSRKLRVSMSFDGRALHGDRRWTDAVVHLFTELNRKLGAFYAASFVLRNVIAKRGIWFDGRSENFPFSRGPWWTGLPPQPTWLSWFGAPYASHVRSASEAYQEFPEGLLLRLGAEPMDRDQLAGVFPSLPPELLSGGDADPMGGSPRPARMIPKIPEATRPESDFPSSGVTGL